MKNKKVTKKRKEVKVDLSDRIAMGKLYFPDYQTRFQEKGGFGVNERLLINDSDELKLWRKKYLQKAEMFSAFGSLGYEHPELLEQYLIDTGYNFKRLKEKALSNKKRERMGDGKNPYKKIVELANNGIPFIHSHTTSSTIIETPDTVYLYGCNGYGYKEMNLRKKLKKEIMQNIADNGLVVPDFTSKDSRYMVYSDEMMSLPSDSSDTDVREFDISKAYYQCAYNLGYMSREVFDECISLPKEIRLRFIGSIATFKRHYIKSGWGISGYFAEKNPILRRVWFHIVKVVDDCMREFMALADDNFMMYYVDGIYVRKYENKSELPATQINYQPTLDFLYDKYGFTFAEKRIYGVTKTTTDEDENKKDFRIHVIKKRDEEKGKKYWVDKPFNPKGSRMEEEKFESEKLLEFYEEKGKDISAAADELLRVFNEKNTKNN